MENPDDIDGTDPDAIDVEVTEDVDLEDPEDIDGLGSLDERDVEEALEGADDMITVDYRELLDGDDNVVGYIDPDGVAHEFGFGSETADEYPIDRAEELDKCRKPGERILLPEGMASELD